MFEAFDAAAPTYADKTAVPTKVGQYFSDAKLPGLNISVLDLMRQAATAARQPLQESHLDLVISVTVGKGGANQPMTVHVSLEDSIISSGGMLFDRNDKRGYFQDQIVVEMFLTSDGQTPRSDFRRVSDGPQTVNGSGATSSSVSVSFSVSGSVNAGFFGGTPTGGGSVGASLGVTNSHSFSRNLADFKAVNTSTQTLIQHTYKMSQSSGAAYDSANDLVPKGDAIGFFDAFKGIVLYNPPDLATSNLPLISQAVWQATSNREYDETIGVAIKVTQRVVMAEGSNNFVEVHAESSGIKMAHWHNQPIVLKPFRVEGGDEKTEL
ncbi:hypothetical protein [Sphingomonas sp.]|uniref:hypothetical protein n=1 Tax=Sphingomonas sp. TaxID=28214 RepID=UPI002DD61EF9|nr:hypothetical protein [Sphingomonas sp.]